MPLIQLAHYSIRSSDLDASRRFYCEVLGLREGSRPLFDFPGAWLYLGDDETTYGAVHLIGEDAGSVAYLGERATGEGTGAFDHIAFLAAGWPEQRARCAAHGVAHVERAVPSLGLFQVFVVDPSGVTVELNYPASEGGGAP
jgi:catechol 2,3-dioxygenase-like lactoylglutathione lyase family enzyme